MARAPVLARPLGAAAAAAAATLVVATVDPHRPGSYGACPLYALTGLYCAGCGGLRATYDLAHGDLAGAWAMNPVWVLLVPVLGALWAAWLVRSWRTAPVPGRPPVTGAAAPQADAALAAAPRAAAPRPASRRWVPWLVLVSVLLYSVLRNVPVLRPWLAP